MNYDCKSCFISLQTEFRKLLFSVTNIFTVMKDAVTTKIPDSKYILFLPDIALENMTFGVTKEVCPATTLDFL